MVTRRDLLKQGAYAAVALSVAPSLIRSARAQAPSPGTTFIDPVSLSLSGVTASTWNPMTNAAIPAGATGVILVAGFAIGHAGTVSVRKTGSTDTHTSGELGTGRQMLMFAGVSSSQEFDLWTTTTAGLQLWLIAYLGSEATFFTNSTPLTALSTAWANYNISASAPGAVAAILSIDSVYGPAVRISGSSDDFSNDNAGATRQYFLVGVNGSQIFQAKALTAGPVPQLLGYMTSGITWNTNAISRTPGTAGSFEPLATESGAAGYLYHFNSPSTSYDYTVREQGLSYNPNLEPANGLGGQNAAGSPAEVDIANTALTVHELGYFTAPGETFNFYLSPTGDDDNTGTLASPWSITAINNNQSAYTGLRVGLLPGVYQYGTKGGVQTSLYTLSQALAAGTCALNVNGGTSATVPTYIASCDASGDYSPRTAVLYPADLVTGDRPSVGYGLIGQSYLSTANKGNVTIDGLVIHYGWSNGIMFFPQDQSSAYPFTGSTLNTGIRVQNCEVYDISGDADNNIGGIFFWQCIGAYAGNNKVHDVTPTTGNIGNCNGIHTFTCHSNIYEYNTVYNVGSGIHDKDNGNGNGNSILRYNFIEINNSNSANNYAPLTGLSGGYVGDNQIVHHNILYAATTEAWDFSSDVVPCPQATQVYNNTVIYGSNGSSGMNWGEGSGNLSVYNNIVVANGFHAGNGCFSVVNNGSYVLGAYNLLDDSTHAPNLGYIATPGRTFPTGVPLATFVSTVGQDSTSEIATPVFAGAFGVQNAANYQLTGSVGVGFGHVGGVSGGASVNAGAWDGVVTQIGANF